MISLPKLVHDHMLVVFFVYGLAFFLLGTAILLKQDKRSTLKLRSLLLLLAGFGLLHGASEWSDMFVALGETYWTPFLFRIIKTIGFYLGLGSFVFLLAFGLRSVALDKSRFKWLERASLIVALLFTVVVSVQGIRTGLSNQWYVTSGVLMRYLLAFPGSLIAAAGLFRQSQSGEIKEINSSAILRNIRGLAVVFVVYALLAGVIVPQAPFPPAAFINYSSFENMFGLPVQIFRAACSLLAALFVSGLLNAFSAVTYGELEKQVQERTSDLAKANETLLTDIAGRKRAEQELTSKAEELARSNAELELFAYVASHDLQEPLRMVASYTQLLARRYKGKLGAEADEFIGFAVDGATRMQQLIQDLLSYSRVTTRGKALNLTQSETACNCALENLQESIKESKTHVSVGPLPGIIADATQLTQLFQNLIGNAIKYRNERRPEISISARPNGSEWTFSIQDNGIGIEPQYFERIFQMFQRLHTRKEYSGTGIGLAVCRKIVERHGGRIWVESQPGQGSTFLFTIPRAEGTEK
jgi:signal transduction histidine kinase